MATIKKEALKLIEHLPEKSTWEDIIYELYVREKIEHGLKAAREGRIVSHEEVKKRFSK